MPEAKPLRFAAPALAGDRVLGRFLDALAAGGAPVTRLDLGPEDGDLRVFDAEDPVFLGGFSRGARLAAEAAASREVRGLVLVGFPFHPRGLPAVLTRLALLEDARVPTLVLQGARDPHGNRERLRGVALPDHVELAFVDEGNHRLQPRARSGLRWEDLVDEAAARSLSFLRA